MFLKNIIFAIVFFIFSTYLSAQIKQLNADEVFENLISSNEEGNYELLHDELLLLSQQPLNLNTTKQPELEQIPFLSSRQIEQIIAYQRDKGGFATIYELQLIKDLDASTIQNLLPFVFIGEQKSKNIFNNLFNKSKHELFMRTHHCFQEKKGYTNKKYLGTPYYHSIRYKYSSSHLQGALIGEKDAGEPFIQSIYNKYGYDYYSFHIQLKDIEILKNGIIGDYRLSFGQGLVLNSGFSLGKNLSSMNAGYHFQGIRPHYSTGENDFMRGVASTFQFKKGIYTLFYSNRYLDAIGDTCCVTSLKKDGIHRVVSDFDKKAFLLMNAYGGNIHYIFDQFEWGITALSYHFGKKINPALKPYNAYIFRGTTNWNIGTDFRIHYHNMHFFGEIACSKNRALATILSLQTPIFSKINLTTSYRYYAKDYHAYYANAFSESDSYNEKGIFFSLEYKPFYELRMATYIDFFHFPWLKYEVNAPSKGSDFLIIADYTKGGKWNFHTDYRFRKKEKNGTTPHILQENKQQKLKLQISYTPLKLLKLKATALLTAINAGNSTVRGYLGGQSITFTSLNQKWNADLGLALFHTDDYESRVWLYENNGIYASTLNSFYGKGIRLTHSVRYKIGDFCKIWGRFTLTKYQDKETIGTALEKIDGNIKSDVSIYLQWIF